MYVCLCVCMCTCALCWRYLYMLEKGVLAPESAVWVVVNSMTYILGMEFEPSARATVLITTESLPSSCNDCYQKDKRSMLSRMWSKGFPVQHGRKCELKWISWKTWCHLKKWETLLDMEKESEIFMPERQMHVTGCCCIFEKVKIWNQPKIHRGMRDTEDGLHTHTVNWYGVLKGRKHSHLWTCGRTWMTVCHVK